MIPYIAVSLIPLLFSIPFRGLNCIDNNIRKRSRFNYVLIVGIILFLFLALRSREVGSQDSINYYNMMKRAISSNSWRAYYIEDGVETGFQLFVFGLSRVFKEPQILLIISSAFIIFGVCVFVYNNCEDIAFSLTMYITLGLMVFQMQGMRQAIAMSICMISFEFAKRRRFITFVLFVLLALQFHRTAIVFIVVYFITKLSFNAITILIVSAISVAILFSSDAIIEYANVIFNSEYVNEVNSGGFIATLIYLLIIIFAILFNKSMKTDKSQSALFYITVVGAVCYLMRYFGALAAERISFYFLFAQMGLLTNTLHGMSTNERIILKTFVYGLMLVLFAYRLYGSDLVPYISILM